MSLRSWLMGLNLGLNVKPLTKRYNMPPPKYFSLTAALYVYYDIIFTFHRVIFQTYFVRNESYNFLLLELNLLCTLKLK